MRRAALYVAACALWAFAPIERDARAESHDEGAAVGRAVQALLRANAADMRACVGSNERAGEALLDVIVKGKAGRDLQVAAARVLKSDPAVAEAARCVAERAQKWSLAPLGTLSIGEGDQIVVPLVFRPDAKPDVRLVEVVKSLDLDGSLHAIYLAKGTGSITYRGRPQKLGPQHGAVIGIPATLECPEKCTAFVVKLPRDTEFLGAWVWSFSSMPVYKLPGGKGTVQLGTDGTPSIPLAFDWLEVNAGASIPTHTHEGSTEITYVVSGSGTMTLAGKNVAIEAGKFYEMPAGVPHSLLSQTPMTIVQLYLPRGPEQRFKP